MAVVPIAERKVGPPSIQVSTPTVGSAVPGAFGEEVGKAQAELGEAGVKAGSALIERMSRITYQRNKWQKDAQNATLAGQYYAGTLDILHNNNKKTINRDGKDYDIEDGILDRNGYNAVGGTNEFVKREFDIRKSILDQVQDPEYRAALEQKINSHFLSLKESVISHEVSQHKAADADAYTALNKNLIESAEISPDPKILGGIIANLEDSNAKAADRFGFDEQTQKLNTDIDIAKAVDNAAMTSLKSTGSLPLAQGLLDSAKAKISDKDYQDIKYQLASYDKQRTQEIRLQTRLNQDDKESKFFDTWASELDKPLSEKTLTPQVLRDEHKAGNISDGFFTSMMNNLLGTEEARVKAEGVKAKNALESDMLDLLRKKELTVDMITDSRTRGSIDANFALQMTRAVEAQTGKGAEKSDYFVKEDILKKIFDPNVPASQIRTDILNANTRKQLTDSARDSLMFIAQHGRKTSVYEDYLVEIGQKVEPKNTIWSTVWGAIKSFIFGAEQEGKVLDRVVGKVKKENAAENDKRILEITNEEIKNQNVENHPEISTFKEEGQLMIDAFGNKATVYPDGRIEEQ